MSASLLPWQDGAWTTLMAQHRAGRMTHGLLIAGRRGLGKRELAFRLAQALLCEDAAAAPCGRCRGCARFVAGTEPDLHHVTRLVDDEGKQAKDISVAQLRELIATLQLSAHGQGWRCAIIEPAETMNASAANALLKTLEEPPARTIIVLVTARPDRLPATIRSRCQRLDLRVPPVAQAVAWLGARAPRDDWDLWLGLADGAPLAAEALAASPLAAQRSAWARTLLDLPEGRGDPLKLAEEWGRVDPRLPLRWWASVVADLIVLAQAGDGRLRNPDLAAVLRNLGGRLHLAALHRFLGSLQRAQQMLETNVNHALVLEALLIAWAARLAPEAMRPILADD
jgi:DNA polymerase-3 subunit delta'